MSSIHALWRRIRYGKPIVIVSGLPRSGTSMAMKMLDAGGLPLLVDGVRTADVDNPKGYYEYERVKDLETEEDKSYLEAARGRGIKIISFLLFHLPEDMQYKVVFMVRHLDEVLASQQKMLGNRGEDHDVEDDTMRKMYENHLWRVRYLMKTNPRFECLEVPYREILDEPRAYAEKIAGFLGGGLDVDAMSGVADRKLYRNRAEKITAT